MALRCNLELWHQGKLIATAEDKGVETRFARNVTSRVWRTLSNSCKFLQWNALRITLQTVDEGFTHLPDSHSGTCVDCSTGGDFSIGASLRTRNTAPTINRNASRWFQPSFASRYQTAKMLKTTKVIIS